MHNTAIWLGLVRSQLYRLLREYISSLVRQVPVPPFPHLSPWVACQYLRRLRPVRCVSGLEGARPADDLLTDHVIFNRSPRGLPEAGLKSATKSLASNFDCNPLLSLSRYWQRLLASRSSSLL